MGLVRLLYLKARPAGCKRFDLSPGRIKPLALEHPLNFREIKSHVNSALLVAGKVGGDGGDEKMDGA